MPKSDRGVSSVRATFAAGVNAGTVLYAPGGTLGPRVQRDYQLVLVHSGTAHIVVDGVWRDIHAAHVGLMLPGRLETYTFAADRETHHSWVALLPDRMDAVTREALDAAAACLPLSASMHACADLARSLANVDDTAERPVLVAIVRAALALYLAESRQVSPAHRLPHPAIQHARARARQRAVEGIGVAGLAREAGLSPEHFTRLFRRDVGIAPGLWLREERLRQAIQLLEQTGLPVTEVARRTGFVSPQHFARRIRAATGMAPRALRRQRWAAAEQARDEG